MATIHFDPIGKFKYTKDDMGNYHSYDDEPAIEYLDGSAKLWYKNGLIHRIDKPAIIYITEPNIKEIGHENDSGSLRNYFKENKNILYYNQKNTNIYYNRLNSISNTTCQSYKIKYVSEYFDNGIKYTTQKLDGDDNMNIDAKDFCNFIIEHIE